MAISPPSDILLDVANAADPARIRAATERLSQLAANPAAGNEGFSKAFAAASRGETKSRGATMAPAPATSKPALSLTSAAALSDARPRSLSTRKVDGPYQKFEAVLLQSFVETMLPKDDQLFGDKMSAGIYRSMMAEQFANQIARAGGIGVAKAIEHAHPEAAKAQAAKIVGGA